MSSWDDLPQPVHEATSAFIDQLEMANGSHALAWEKYWLSVDEGDGPAEEPGQDDGFFAPSYGFSLAVAHPDRGVYEDKVTVQYNTCWARGMDFVRDVELVFGAFANGWDVVRLTMPEFLAFPTDRLSEMLAEVNRQNAERPSVKFWVNADRGTVSAGMSRHLLGLKSDVGWECRVLLEELVHTADAAYPELRRALGA